MNELCVCVCQVVLSEEELVGAEQVSATAEVSVSMMRMKMELDEKKRSVNILQSALVGKHTERIILD